MKGEKDGWIGSVYKGTKMARVIFGCLLSSYQLAVVVRSKRWWSHRFGIWPGGVDGGHKNKDDKETKMALIPRIRRGENLVPKLLAGKS